LQIIRTIVIVLIAAAISAFVAMNWTVVSINILPNWQNGTPATPGAAQATAYVSLHWPLGMVVVVAFLCGLVPMWVMSKAGRWRLKRRIATLENTVRATTPTPPLATSTQLDAAAQKAD